MFYDQVPVNFLKNDIPIAITVIIKPVFYVGDGTRGFTSNLKTNAPAVPRRPAVRRFTFLFAFKGITVLTAVFLGSPGLDGSLTLFAWQKAILLAATAIRFFGFMFFFGRFHKVIHNLTPVTHQEPQV